jgi:hypothetical protein
VQLDRVPAAREGQIILLKPALSGQRLVAAVLRADHLDFGAAFEPWPEQVRVVQPLLRFLEELHPLTFMWASDYDPQIQSSAARQIEAAARVNEDLTRMGELKPEGLHVLAGQYTFWGRRLHRNLEGFWCRFLDDPREVLAVAAVRIAPVSTMSLRIPLKGQPVPPKEDSSSQPRGSGPVWDGSRVTVSTMTGGPNWEAPSGGDLDDEIPF